MQRDDMHADAALDAGTTRCRMVTPFAGWDKNASGKRSPTLNRPQNRPNCSLISRAWPTPVTAPSHTTISW